MARAYQEQVKYIKGINQANTADYATIINNLTDRLVESERRRKSLRENLALIKQTWEDYQENCHDCRKYNTEHRSVGCQANIRPKPMAIKSRQDQDRPNFRPESEASPESASEMVKQAPKESTEIEIIDISDSD